VSCNQTCRYGPLRHTDAAKRISDATILAWTAKGWDGCIGKWLAFRMADGSTTHDLYDSKKDAVRHQSGLVPIIFLPMNVGGTPVCAAELLLDLHRKAYDRGFEQSDRDHIAPDIIPRIGYDKLSTQIRALS